MSRWRGNCSQFDGSECRDLIGWEVIAPAVLEHMARSGNDDASGLFTIARNRFVELTPSMCEYEEDGVFSWNKTQQAVSVQLQ